MARPRNLGNRVAEQLAPSQPQSHGCTGSVLARPPGEGGRPATHRPVGEASPSYDDCSAAPPALYRLAGMKDAECACGRLWFATATGHHHAASPFKMGTYTEYGAVPQLLIARLDDPLVPSTGPSHTFSNELGRE